VDSSRATPFGAHAYGDVPGSGRRSELSGL